VERIQICGNEFYFVNLFRVNELYFVRTINDYLLVYVSLKNISLIWRRHHYRWTKKFRLMLGTWGLWAGMDLYRATPAVTRGLGFSGLIWRTAPFSRLLRHRRGCGESINPDPHGSQVWLKLADCFLLKRFFPINMYKYKTCFPSCGPSRPLGTIISTRLSMQYVRMLSCKSKLFWLNGSQEFFSMTTPHFFSLFPLGREPGPLMGQFLILVTRMILYQVWLILASWFWRNFFFQNKHM
jgi:hypothetical protein